MFQDANRADPFADAEIVKSLLGRQDAVIAELDALETQILDVIQEVNANRETTNAMPETGQSETGQSETGQSEFVPVKPVAATFKNAA